MTVTPDSGDSKSARIAAQIDALEDEMLEAARASIPDATLSDCSEFDVWKHDQLCAAYFKAVEEDGKR
ncbi:hypothetical protein ABIF68_007607 [Bradyrhizobium japonicum]|uniref:hypothetical protein n=1 Tax=Bradyrhizobium TaxID=374 RepID=UPI0004B33928|nr:MULTISPECIES: hypothetical protein [Bradyrhizobium]MBR0948281.1 hypothetical protein [Bradyrhizobium liaoningense]